MVALISFEKTSTKMFCSFYHVVNACLTPCFFAGDEIFTVNGQSVAGLTHAQAMGMFKATKVGSIQVTLGRREPKKASADKEKKKDSGS